MNIEKELLSKLLNKINVLLNFKIKFFVIKSKN